MRSFLFAVALVGCARSATTGPAWPKPATAETDGGESLDPHVSRREVTEIERSDDDVKPPATETPIVKPSAPAAATSAGTPAAPPQTPTEETITTEDIIIEIDD